MLDPTLLIDLGVLAALLLLGFLVSRLVLARAGRLERAALAFPLGAGLLTWILFVASWAGMALNRLSVAGVYLVLLLSISSLLRVRSNAAEPEEAPLPGEVGGSSQRWLRLTIGLFAALTALGGFISIGLSYSTWDAAGMWGIKGYGIAKEGSVFAAVRWGAQGFGYPLNIHFLVSMFKLATADNLPGSKLIFTFYQGSALLGCAGYWLRKRVSPALAGIGLLFLGTVPVIFEHSTLGFANMPTTAYLVLGSLYGVEGMLERRKDFQTLSGILLGLAAWTIVEGLLYSLLVIALLGLASMVVHARKLHVLRILGFALLVSGPWWVFFQLYGASRSQALGTAQQMFASFAAGDYNLEVMRIIFGYTRRYLFDVSTWGLLFPAGAILILLRVRRFASRIDPVASVLLLLFLGTAGLTAALFYLRSFLGLDILAWLMRGFPRAFLPSALLFGVLTTLLLDSLEKELNSGRESPPKVTSPAL